MDLSLSLVFCCRFFFFSLLISVQIESDQVTIIHFRYKVSGSINLHYVSTLIFITTSASFETLGIFFTLNPTSQPYSPDITNNVTRHTLSLLHRRRPKHKSI